MTSIVFLFIFSRFLQIQPDYKIIVNGSASNEFVYKGRPNTFVMQGADADKIRLSSTQAIIKRKGNSFSVVLTQDFREILVLVTYVINGEESQLGYYKFSVIDL